MTDTTKTLLKEGGIRLTESRESILGYLLKSGRAVAQPELEKAFEQFDRVTIYRTLNTFIEKGIIHEVSDGSIATKYAVCSDQCTTHEHHDEHVHFCCGNCGQTTCIDTIAIPQIQLPNGYQFANSSYVINGTCKDCSQLMA